MFEGGASFASLPRDTRHHAAHGWLERLVARGEFEPDLRFGPRTPPDANACAAEAERAQLQAAIDLAYEQGRTDGEGAAEARARIEMAARERLGMELRQLDVSLQQTLAEALRETVAVLCRDLITNAAADAERLQRRCEAAAAMLGGTIGDLRLYLHPDDIAPLDPAFAAGWTITPDPEAERGSLKLESGDSGICDGPAVWRDQIDAALRVC